MRNSMLTSGVGKRACTGKDVALLEVYKCAASLFLTWDMRFVDREREWRLVRGGVFL